MGAWEFKEWRWNFFVLGSLSESLFSTPRLVSVLDLWTRAACISGCERLARELQVRLDRGGVYGAEAVADGVDVGDGAL